MKKRINKKIILLLIGVLAVVFTTIIIVMLNTNKTLGNIQEVEIKGKVYYQRLNDETWNGEYHQDEFEVYIEHGTGNIVKVVSYSDYLSIINDINRAINDSNNELENYGKYNGHNYKKYENISNYYTNKNANYIILSYSNGTSWCKMDLINCIEENNKIIIYGQEYVRGSMASGSGYFIAIPTNMKVGTEIEYRECYTEEEIENIKKYGVSYNPGSISADKPVIYLYPTEETEVTVKVGRPENLTHTYPKYIDKWNVIAKPNGDLVDVETGRNLYCLYWEGLNTVEPNMSEGFIVKGEDTISFLEEKLEILGLTEREANEFIIYWLPKLESNKYNYIRFQTMKEINENMPLEITPTPDTVIRVLMEYKGLDNPINVTEQKLATPERNGFTVVEWGGTEIN